MRKLFIVWFPIWLIGCLEDDPSDWFYQEPAATHSADGFTWAMFGPRGSGYLADDAPSNSSGLVTDAEVGVALKARAVELARRTGISDQSAIDTLRSLRIWIVDDYNFDVNGQWASGWYRPEYGMIVVALWARTETALESDIPSDAPAWTIRPPDFENLNWRYGGKHRLVPAADHELGHHFFGAGFEH